MGIDQENGMIYIHDPFLAQTPIAMELLRFETGREELGRQYTVISLTPALKPQTPNFDALILDMQP
jgi:hypothetical protein